jgi:hypothetical protein
LRERRQQVALGSSHALGLLSNGSILPLGSNSDNQLTIPTTKLEGRKVISVFGLLLQMVDGTWSGDSCSGLKACHDDNSSVLQHNVHFSQRERKIFTVCATGPERLCAVKFCVI